MTSSFFSQDMAILSLQISKIPLLDLLTFFWSQGCENSPKNDTLGDRLLSSKFF